MTFPLWMIELGVATLVFALVFGVNLFILKPEFMQGEDKMVRVGAGLHALTLAAVVGFLFVPLRLAFLGDAPAATPSWLPAAAIGAVVFVRIGGLRRIPGLKPALVAHRKAVLRRTIAKSQEQLDKLTAAPRASGET